jgi:hypothetical protein
LIINLAMLFIINYSKIKNFMLETIVKSYTFVGTIVVLIALAVAVYRYAKSVINANRIK